MSQILPTSTHDLNKVVEQYCSNLITDNKVFEEAIQTITANIIEQKKKFYINLRTTISDMYSEPQNITLEQILPLFVLAINNYYKNTTKIERINGCIDPYLAEIDPYLRDMADALYLKYFNGEKLSASLSTGD